MGSLRWLPHRISSHYAPKKKKYSQIKWDYVDPFINRVRFWWLDQVPLKILLMHISPTSVIIGARPIKQGLSWLQSTIQTAPTELPLFNKTLVIFNQKQRKKMLASFLRRQLYSGWDHWYRFSSFKMRHMALALWSPSLRPVSLHSFVVLYFFLLMFFDHGVLQ